MATLKVSAPRSYQLIQTLHAIDPDVTGKATKLARAQAEAEYQNMDLATWEAHVASEAAFYARMVERKAEMARAYARLLEATGRGDATPAGLAPVNYRKMYQAERLEAYLARRAARVEVRHAA